MSENLGRSQVTLSHAEGEDGVAFTQWRLNTNQKILGIGKPTTFSANCLMQIIRELLRGIVIW